MLRSEYVLSAVNSPRATLDQVYFPVEAILSTLVEDGQCEVSGKADIPGTEAVVGLEGEVLFDLVAVHLIAVNDDGHLGGVGQVLPEPAEHQVQNGDLLVQIDGAQELVLLVEAGRVACAHQHQGNFMRRGVPLLEESRFLPSCTMTSFSLLKATWLGTRTTLVFSDLLGLSPSLSFLK